MGKGGLLHGEGEEEQALENTSQKNYLIKTRIPLLGGGVKRAFVIISASLSEK